MQCLQGHLSLASQQIHSVTHQLLLHRHHHCNPLTVIYIHVFPLHLGLTLQTSTVYHLVLQSLLQLTHIQCLHQLLVHLIHTVLSPQHQDLSLLNRLHAAHHQNPFLNLLHLHMHRHHPLHVLMMISTHNLQQHPLQEVSQETQQGSSISENYSKGLRGVKELELIHQLSRHL